MVNPLKKASTEHNLLVYCVLYEKKAPTEQFIAFPKNLFCFHDTALRTIAEDVGKVLNWIFFPNLVSPCGFLLFLAFLKRLVK